jgi:hypothetical protein
LKVLYILGAGRSGSTILGNVLGESEGYFHAGELRGIWGNGLVRGQSCGCGTPVPECPIWSAVVAATFADPEVPKADPRTVERWKVALRMRHTWRLLRESPRHLSEWAELDAYTRVMAGLYKHLAEVTGSSVVLDSSKRSSDGALLRLMHGIEPFYVHLVRDPRAVAFSWQRVKPSLGSPRLSEMPRFGPNESTRYWTELNMGAELIRRSHPADRYMLVRYEDFILRPRATIESVATMMGQPASEAPFVDERTVNLQPNHTVGGNPDRLKHGPIQLRSDDEWIDRQASRDRLKATAVAFPLLARYGYPVRQHARHHDS